jgi:pimeloyl-ACP methyl ester carboxylesterase
MRALFVALAVIAALFGAASESAAQKVGVVVLHGRWGSPGGSVLDLARHLEREGHPVANPEMPWSGSRSYDKGAAAFVGEIDAAVADLRARGAAKIAIAGHSQGAMAALYYATQREVSGIALIAPGGYAQGKLFVEHYGSTVTEARRLAAEGRGGETMSFTDLNTGNRTRRLSAPAASVLDYFNPEGPMNSFRIAPQVKPGTAVLWVAPTRESEGLKRLSEMTFERLPAQAVRSRVDVAADHLNAPDAAKQAIVDWLKGL